MFFSWRVKNQQMIGVRTKMSPIMIPYGSIIALRLFDCFMRYDGK